MDDYESLPPATPLSVSCTAGAMAGVGEHCAMFPVDSVKTRMQSLSCSKQRSLNMRQVALSMVKEEGFRRAWRGMPAMAVGAGPAHAMYFTCLEIGKEQSQKLNLTNNMAPFADGFSAVFATICHDTIMTPAEVVKQRMQMCCSPFSSCMTATANIYKTEGLRAFYRSYFTQLTMNIPFQASLVISYNSIQRFLNPNHEYNPAIHFIAGGLAGGVASTVTMPHDNCKTLLNTQEAGVLKKIGLTEINGMMGAAKSVHRMVGFGGFFSGLTARILYQAPATAISWSVYELVKYYMNANKTNDNFDNCDTLSTLKEQINRQEITQNYFSVELENEDPNNKMDNLIKLSVKDEQSVGSSVSHTISLASDLPLPLSHPLHSISSRQFLSASSNVNDGCDERTVGYS